jgi:hypothetical protein
VIAVPPPESREPPQHAEGAPGENGTPTDHSNVKSHFIKQYCNATLGRWSPLTWALSYAGAGHLVIPLEHGDISGSGFRRWQRNEDAHRLACRLWDYHWPDGDLVSSIMHDIWVVTDQVADDQFPWSEVASSIRRAERNVGPEAEIHHQWTESLRRVL